MKLLFSGVVEGLSTRNDGSLKVAIATQECDSQQAGELFQLRNKFVKVLLSDTAITDLQAKLVDEEQMADTRKSKSPSQKLRAVMYRVHEQQGIQQDFDGWYKSEMERIRESYLQILNDNQ